ncbi:MAG: DUF2804 domain-containing protein, partial [Bacilli bacterium]
SRIKEWDYYYIGNDKYGVALTIADNSYMSMVSATFIDLVNKAEVTKSEIKLFSRGNLALPFTSKEGDSIYLSKKFSMEFVNHGKMRKLVCSVRNFDGKKDFYCNITLEQTMKKTMVIATPFKKMRHFYYNQKINCMKAQGHFVIGTKDYTVDNNRAVLDWGRGIWTYKNTWYWSSMSSVTEDGKDIGWNLGYGFGNNTKATENMLFFDNEAYKLGQVEFKIPHNKNKYYYMKEWELTSEDGMIQLAFKPIYNRHSSTNALIIKSNQNQVFGVFNGTIKAQYMKNGEVKEILVEVKNMTGFAERVYNKW